MILLVDSAKVYIDDDGIIYDASLNQTNIGGNNNKARDPRERAAGRLKKTSSTEHRFSKLETSSMLTPVGVALEILAKSRLWVPMI